jgi:hypothetical protein
MLTGSLTDTERNLRKFSLGARTDQHPALLLTKCWFTLLLPTTRRNVMLLLDLPTELLLSVLEYVNVWEWKQVRQTCRSLSELATPLLFKEINFELCEHGCESLYNISQNSVLNCFVKTIALRRIRGYRKFADFDAWVKCIHQPGTPDHIPWKTCHTTYYEDKELRSQLMPYEEWARLSKEEKNVLYEAYNADRQLQNKDIRSIANTEAGNVSVT